MLIVKMQGGLGNQLFQYAFAKGLEHRTGKSVFFDTSEYDSNSFRKFQLDAFCMEYKVASSRDVNAIKSTGFFLRTLGKAVPYFFKSQVFREKNLAYDPSCFEIKGNVYYDGYWQSEKYFQQVKDTLFQELKLKQIQNIRFIDLKNEIERQNETVSLHFRRGDYVSDPNTNLFHGVCGLDYYERSIRFISSKVGISRLYVFSDDLDWVRENFKSEIPITFVGEEVSDVESLLLMSFCNHQVVANSTFSWWGGWLSQNDGFKIAPQKWFSAKEKESSDIVPDSWVVL